MRFSGFLITDPIARRATLAAFSNLGMGIAQRTFNSGQLWVNMNSTAWGTKRHVSQQREPNRAIWSANLRMYPSTLFQERGKTSLHHDSLLVCILLVESTASRTYVLESAKAVNKTRVERSHTVQRRIPIVLTRKRKINKAP
jgi:hypothetical protein